MEEAQTIYGALGNNHWKQFVDGQDFSYGPMVYDTGAHVSDPSTNQEPGYYESACKAFDFVRAHLSERLTLNFYQELHGIACAHFQGEANHTQMTSKEVGQFRGKREDGRTPKSGVNLELFLIFQNRKSPIWKADIPLIRKFVKVHILDCQFRQREGLEQLVIDAFYKKGFLEGLTDEKKHQFHMLYQEGFSKVIGYLRELEESEPELTPFLPYFTCEAHQLTVHYSSVDEVKQLDDLVGSLIAKFNEKIDQLDHQLNVSKPQDQEKVQKIAKEKLIAIADLYQKLEWIHPFTDGQGRTDRFILDKLLTENGFCPVLCYDPYVSTYSNLKDFVEYVEEGMKNWVRVAYGAEKNPFEIPPKEDLTQYQRNWQEITKEVLHTLTTTLFGVIAKSKV